ncbi:hypothetical protein [Pedobacter xixiisoli]|uniref:Uncharacterized protein n=1 Tax=Pedobacter xixiisoli TaxID=1476464 RepID=A0A285ZNG8_9SPHI|nr:hypothetical protein [Pedobacter xixiisoli]SOD11195.1 hypothetical protein SAMN06297358_0028 [Pedobacter xixiisoli]
MSNTEKNRPKGSIAITAFLIIILSTTEIPPLLKYPMLAIATISFIIVAVRLYHEFKTKQLLKDRK